MCFWHIRRPHQLFYFINIVCQRIKFKSLVLLHKIPYNDKAEYYDGITTKIRQRIAHHRWNANIRLPMARSKYGKRYFTFAGAKLWNSLTREPKLESDDLIPRKKLKTHRFQQHFY